MLLNDINYELLKFQKLILLGCIDKSETTIDRLALEGLLQLIDSIQDEASEERIQENGIIYEQNPEEKYFTYSIPNEDVECDRFPTKLDLKLHVLQILVRVPETYTDALLQKFMGWSVEEILNHIGWKLNTYDDFVD